MLRNVDKISDRSYASDTHVTTQLHSCLRRSEVTPTPCLCYSPSTYKICQCTLQPSFPPLSPFLPYSHMSRNGRPLDLPGLYWDEEKCRYFPIASRPKASAIAEQSRVQNTRQDETPVVYEQEVSPRTMPMSRILREMRGGRLSASGLADAMQ